jgi:hypothetical protein
LTLITVQGGKTSGGQVSTIKGWKVACEEEMEDQGQHRVGAPPKLHDPMMVWPEKR